MRTPVSDGMLYAPRYPRARGTEKKETGLLISSYFSSCDVLRVKWQKDCYVPIAKTPKRLRTAKKVKIRLALLGRHIGDGSQSASRIRQMIGVYSFRGQCCLVGVRAG